MNRDPLELLGDLPDWPGNTPPKNRSTTQKPISSEKYNGAKSKTYRISGIDRELLTVGELAKALGRKAITIRMWENQGWIPKATYRTSPPSGQQIPGKPSKGRRLYSIEQLETLLKAASLYSIDQPSKANWDGFKQYVKNNWPTK